MLILAILMAAAKLPLKWPLLWSWLHMVSSASPFSPQRPPTRTYPQSHSTDIAQEYKGSNPQWQRTKYGSNSACFPQEEHFCSIQRTTTQAPWNLRFPPWQGTWQSTWLFLFPLKTQHPRQNLTSDFATKVLGDPGKDSLWALAFPLDNK